WSNLSSLHVAAQTAPVTATNTLLSGVPEGKYHFYVTTLDDPSPLTGSLFTNEAWYSSASHVTVTYTTIIAVSKSISNIALNNNPVAAIPGSTITYKISYSNLGLISAWNVVVYDRLSPRVTFSTAAMGSATGWTIQYSTNTTPLQDYNSAQYSNNYISKDRIKWIRWKKPDMGTVEDGRSLVYKVIIK
ncbi:MAG: hypothetical protein PHF84_04360, partial [bacterium]|nr:hypothetical protein [bacterium]